ncbi:MAG: hypothetical protein ACYDEN_08240 [Acidimicrobiales bacterium]
MTVGACGSGSSTTKLGTLIVTAPPCPGPAGIYEGRTKLVVSGNGVHWTKTLDGPPVVITSGTTKPAPSYTVTMALPAGGYSLKDVEGGTRATVTVRANTTQNFDLGSSCS